jgi:4-hydroxy-4-methyl-2-oxoglutarate aldolase
MSSLSRALDIWLALGTSTIYEASRLRCALDPALRPAWPGAEISGPAFPVLCVPGDNLAIHRAVENAPAGSVLVVAGGGRLVGYWGEILTRAAQRQGITGLVIDGGVRDIDALDRLAFPVFARGVSMLGTEKSAVGSIGEPVDLAGVVVETGDLVVADRDGVVCVPSGELARVLAASQARRATELAMIEMIGTGAKTLDLFGWRGLVDAMVRGETSPVPDPINSQGAL